MYNRTTYRLVTELRDTIKQRVYKFRSSYWGSMVKVGHYIKGNQSFIGIISTGPKDELPTPNREINYGISRDYRGKGYTTQASRGLLNYLYGKTNITVLNAIALIDNIPSNKVIQKSGFKYISNIEIDNKEYKYYKLSKNEWEINSIL